VQLSFTRITSPVSGRVGLRHVDPGNLVTAGSATGIVTVTQIDPISVVFTLPQDLLPRIQSLLTQPAATQVVVRERAGGSELARGRLSMIDNQVDTTTGSIRLRAEFVNDSGRLWPGQFVAVQLQTGISPAAVTVPVRAVRQRGEGSYVFRVRDGKAEVVTVEVVYQDGTTAVIGAGLEPGEEVVIDGHSRLREGSRVRVDEARLAAAAGAKESQR
jgi:RND family efflux transporter MFP subunit